MADPTMDDPASGESDDSQPDMSKGYCIEIRVTADNQVSVGVEPLADEDAEEGAGGAGDGGDNEDYQSVPSFGAALQIAKDIYAHAGEIQDSGSGNDDMSSGYGDGK